MRSATITANMTPADPEEEHAHEGDHGRAELEGADLTQVLERRALDEARDGREDEGGRRGLGQVAEGSGQEQEDRGDRDGREDEESGRSERRQPR
jgi:hypothetical protein